MRGAALSGRACEPRLGEAVHGSGSWLAVDSLPRLLQSEPGRRKGGLQNRRGLQRYGSHHGESLLGAAVFSIARTTAERPLANMEMEP